MAQGTCFLFLGPEQGEKQDAVAEIRRRLTRAGGTGSLEETVFYAGENSVSEILGLLRNGSLFADSRLFLIKNAELLKKDDDLELLGAYLKAPQADTALILLSEATSLSKKLEQYFPGAAKRIFWELFEDRKIDWLAALFRREGYTITAEGIEAVLGLVENNTDALRRECTRLMPFLEKGRPVEGRDVEKWLAHTREESAFTLFARIARGDLSQSLEILHTLLAAKEPSPAILAALAWCFRKLRDYLAVTGSGRATELDFKKIGLGSSLARASYVQAARRYTQADTALSLLAEFEVLLRSSGSALELILWDLLLYKLVADPSDSRERRGYY
jgi:DNA polymerase-3 subunit delta